MIKALISDIDGTIIRDGGISRETRAVIQHFMDDGLVILNTGRSLESIQQLKDEFQFDTYGFAITCNGSYICTHEGKVLLNETLPAKVAQTLLEKLPTSYLKVAAAGKIYGVEYPYTLPENCQLTTINKISIRIENEKIAEKLHQVVQNLDVRLEINTHYADLIPSQCDKGKGAHYLMQLLGLYDDEVLVVGDDYNDIAMLKEFPHSYTFNDSPDQVKQSAHHLIDSYAELPYK